MAPDFLALPQRTAKPRRRGLTHVLDKGMPAGELEALLQVCGPYVDIWKMGWGTAYLDPGLAEKISILTRHGVLACTGGTLLEVAFHQGVVDDYLGWVADTGFPCIEVSCGAVGMSALQKRSLIEMVASRFVVLGEVGAKDPAVQVAGPTWAKAAEADLAAGATWVVTEGRESGTVGLYEPTGEVRVDILDAVVAAVGAEAIVFEAPRKDQQAWLIRRLGPDVNLGNVAPGEVLGLETLRLGLRADTLAVLPSRTGAP